MIIKNSFKFQNLIYKSSDSPAKLWSYHINNTNSMDVFLFFQPIPSTYGIFTYI